MNFCVCFFFSLEDAAAHPYGGSNSAYGISGCAKNQQTNTGSTNTAMPSGTSNHANVHSQRRKRGRPPKEVANMQGQPSNATSHMQPIGEPLTPDPTEGYSSSSIFMCTN